MNLTELSHQVQLLEPDEFWVATGVLVVMSVAGAVMAWLKLTKGRQIQDTPTSKIRSAAQGYVELEGIARMLPGEPVVSPLTGQQCCWWKYSVEEKRTSYSNGRRNTRWATIESASSDDLFQLVDDTGDCVVDPDGAKVIPNNRVRWYGSSRRPMSKPDKSPFFGLGSYRYTEQIVSTGSPLYALGWFRTQGGIAHSFDDRSAVRELLAEWKADQGRLLREFDSNGDGQIDMDEWTAVREKAIAEVQKRQLETAIDPDIHILCRPPHRRRFLLSTVAQDDLIRQARRYVIAGMALFLICGAAAVWLATVRGVL